MTNETTRPRNARSADDWHQHTCQSCGKLWFCDANNPYTDNEDLDCRWYRNVLCPDCERRCIKQLNKKLNELTRSKKEEQNA